MSAVTRTRSAETDFTTPPRLASTHTPESTPALYSMPVPTMGLSVLSRGTAWRCMLEPIMARFASSCSRKGMQAVATDTTILGVMSI